VNPAGHGKTGVDKKDRKGSLSGGAKSAGKRKNESTKTCFWDTVREGKEGISILQGIWQEKT